MEAASRSGYVAIIGRPNVGKSTLLNALLGQKIAIVTDRPQTTRNRLLGIKTLPEAQIIFIDTPGIHHPRNLLGKRMVHTAYEAFQEIDLVMFMTDSGKALGQDREILSSLEAARCPVFLLINKIDEMPKADLPRMIGEYSELRPFSEIIPVSAEKLTNLDVLLENIIKYLPCGPKYYPDDLVTDQMERFMATEIIREKIMLKTSDEIPYSVAVEVLEWKERPNGVVAISANIYVERDGQKGIIIGSKGKLLKLIGTSARLELEQLLGTKVFLELWVKVRGGWRDDKNALHELGYK